MLTGSIIQYDRTVCLFLRLQTVSHFALPQYRHLLPPSTPSPPKTPDGSPYILPDPYSNMHTTLYYYSVTTRFLVVSFSSMIRTSNPYFSITQINKCDQSTKATVFITKIGSDVIHKLSLLHICICIKGCTGQPKLIIFCINDNASKQIKLA